jgi:hypothetical protein
MVRASSLVGKVFIITIVVVFVVFVFAVADIA